METHEPAHVHAEGDTDEGDTDESGAQIVALLDDSTGVVEIHLDEHYEQLRKFGETGNLAKGMYIAVLALLDASPDKNILAAYSVKDLSSQPDRFAMWMCELVDRKVPSSLKSEPPA